MTIASNDRPQGRFPDLPLAIKSIAGFWVFYLLTVMLRSALIDGGMVKMFGGKILGVGLGALLTFLVYLILRFFAARGSLRRMVIVAAIACVPAAFLFSAFNFSMFFLHEPVVIQTISNERAKGGTIPGLPSNVTRGPGGEGMVAKSISPREFLMMQAPRRIADGTVTWYFFFAAWASFYVAMSSATQLRLAERRASEFESAAQSAQLRALRYQVNPHFLFNTLNSLSSLIMAKREEEAERMIMNLSNFFRASLATDPTADVSLSEEIALQRLYLDIEQARFPNRLQVEVDIPERLQSARVPALLLQPIVENAIKYGVARAKDVVTLSIRAEQEGARLRILVENSGEVLDAEDLRGDDTSTGVGLVNVCQRLAARFGVSTSCDYGPRPDGGFRVALSMPLVTHV